MKDSDKSILLKLLALGRKIELTAASAPGDELSPSVLAEILALKGAFESSSDVGLQKLAELADGLHPAMGIERFTHFMVPLERLLDRSAKDFDFIISTEDKPRAGAVGATTRVPLVGVLDHLRSGFNVGSIFRVADGFAFDHLHLVGYTATPQDPGVAKTSLGAEKTVPWTRWGTMEACFTRLRADGYRIVAMETSPSAHTLNTFQFPEKTALVIGNERFGLNYETVEKCDFTVAIPLRGTKNSLNVVSAFAIAGYEWSRQWTHLSK